GQVSKQSFAAQLVQQQQAVGLEQGLGVAQAVADVSRSVQNVGRDDQVVATRLKALRSSGFFHVEEPVGQVRIVRAVLLFGVHEEGPGDIGITILQNVVPVGG